MKADYVIYTASDPDACQLERVLEDKGFITAPSPPDAAMVLVVEADTKRLPRVVRDIVKKEGITYWKLSRVGKAYKVGGS